MAKHEIKLKQAEKRFSRNSVLNVDVQEVEESGTYEVTAGEVFVEKGNFIVTEGDIVYAVHKNDLNKNFEAARPAKDIEDFRQGKKTGKAK